MSQEFAEAIRQVVQEKGISNDLVQKVVEDFLMAAYKRTYGTDENAQVVFDELGGGFDLFARKKIVADDDLYNPVEEIILTEALELNEECEVGDEILIRIDPRSFDRQAVMTAKQRSKQFLKDIQKDTLYAEYKDKVGQVIVGYFQRERNGTIYIDLGKIEGILPKKEQSPREIYRLNDRIKTMIKEVKKGDDGLKVILTRRDPEFVKRILELEVPEIYDQTVNIVKIVREAGFRTKIAVSSNREDVDPIGACVGLKGVRIQAIIKELEGERIDVLRYDPDPRNYIRNSLSPAMVSQVIILDEKKKSALAVVAESQLSQAIGKMGTNVKLANKLVDWTIDVKTEEQVEEMDLNMEVRTRAESLFNDLESAETITKVSELENISERVVSILNENGIELIENLITMSREEIERIEGLTSLDAQNLFKVLEESVELVNEEEFYDDVAQEAQDDVEYEEESYECPECGHPVDVGMSACPSCGVGLSFEVEDEDME